ncbi:glycosyltransferase family 4 protein [Patescibacteria group bacterium]|nr:glycosyltransferase family 4 protein [Patescibacteria group bacterium]
MKNRILILTGVFLEGIGGPSTLLKALNKDLIERGYKVTVLTYGKKKKAKEYPYSVKVVSNKWPSFLRSFIYLKKGLWLALRSDIIYNQDLYTAGLTSLIIKRFLGKKLVTRFVGDSAWETALNQGETIDDILTFQDKKYSHLIERRKKIRKKILLNSDKVIVASNFLRNLALKIGVSDEKIKVIYNSVDFLDINDDLKVDLKKELNVSGRVILTNARLTLWKGVDMLIKIMPRLIEKYGDINFIIISEGPERKNLEKLVLDLDIEKNVFFVGRVSRQLVVSYLKIADVFVLNTNYEGMSFVILEAMKVGAPIITTPAGGNPETIKDGQTGLLVNYRNKGQWLKAISRILDNSELAERLVDNAKKDLKRFSWDNLVKETINVFENICIKKN